MVTQATDIAIVLSGGATNVYPDNSIGGEPSATPIVNERVNNLFNDITASEAQAGGEDYRCFYIFNDGDTTIYNVNSWILQKMPGDSVIQVGIKNYDEMQRIIINGVPTLGSLTLSYESIDFYWAFQTDLTLWALDLQNTINRLVDNDGNHLLRQVVVIARDMGGVYVFDINFQGQDGSKSHDLIALVANNLGVDVVINRQQAGSPVNTIAELVVTQNTAPIYVGFYVAAEHSPITIPKLQPTEGFPIWVRRIWPEETESLELDNFHFRIQAASLDPLHGLII